jgi:hypothetical protein
MPPPFIEKSPSLGRSEKVAGASEPQFAQPRPTLFARVQRFLVASLLRWNSRLVETLPSVRRTGRTT